MRDFDIELLLGGVEEITPQIADALYEAGCSDATLGRRDSSTYLLFTRSAKSLFEAISSATRDVMDANIGAKVLRVKCVI